MMFAQFQDSSLIITAVVIGMSFLGLSTLIWGIRQGVGLWHDVKDKPTGSEVMTAAHQTFATKPEVAAVKQELSQRIGEVDQDLQKEKERIIKTGDDRRKSIEGKVEDTRKDLSAEVEKVAIEVSDAKVAIGEFRGELKQINLTMMNMNSSLQQLHMQQAKHHKDS